MAEQQKYDVLSQFDGWELRRYPTHLVAEIHVEGSFDEAVNKGFRSLASFIFGDNVGEQKVAMTAPVVQEPLSQKIAMTAPVMHEATGEDHVVSFVMPADYTMENLPRPKDPNVRIRQVGEGLAAVREFSGRSTETRFAEQLEGLMGRLQERPDLAITGEPRYARFDPPWKPWFLRRNEVVVPVQPADG